MRTAYAELTHACLVIKMSSLENPLTHPDEI